MRTKEQEVAAYTYLKPAEIAERLNCEPAHVLNLIHAKALPAINIGTGKRPEYRVDPAAFEAFIVARSTRPAA
jgi:excisionase family DNA binding protein